MKKILAFIILFFLFQNNIFAYNPNKTDYKILNKIYEKIDPICEKSPKSCENLVLKIDKIKINYKQNPRIYYILWELKNHINKNFLKEKQKIINYENKVYITKVIDWDTVIFYKNNKKIVARLIWIDAPENSKTRFWHTEKLWNKAKDFLENEIFHKYVFIEYDSSQARTDKYWRHLVYIFLDWENINQKLIKVWLAKEYTYSKPYKYQKKFLKAQEIAKQNKLWIWQFSKKTREKIIKEIDDHKDIPLNKNCTIKGNINSKWEKIYHLPQCKSYKQTKISISKWEKWFCSETEAVNAWFRKAGNCE